MKYFKTIVISLCVFSAIAITATLFLQKDHSKEPSNRPIPPDKSIGAISSLEKVKIGGIDQWIYINGNDVSKPVLLFLHGGPGYSMLPILHEYNSELEKYYTVVNWDQRGAGLSYSSKIPKSTMTLKQFISDTHELTSYLKQRFKQEKIFLAGHSFGTILGMEAINKYPEDYHAFVGIGQVVSFAENEQHSYDFALKSAEEANNGKAIKELIKIGRPDENGNYKIDSGYETTIEWLEYFGGSLHGRNSTEALEEWILGSPIYKDAKHKVESGWIFSDYIFEDKEVRNLNYKNKIKSVEVPVYFFCGIYDYETPSKLVEEYFNVLSAPSKELVWFENSAHFPFYEEPHKFNDIMINKVLAQALIPDDLSGVWKGTYITNQLTNKMTLDIQKNDSGNYWANFHFETSDIGYGSITGSYKMTISYDTSNNCLVFTGYEWIDKPEGFEMLNLYANISENSLRGNVYMQDRITFAGEFSIEKNIN